VRDQLFSAEKYDESFHIIKYSIGIIVFTLGVGGAYRCGFTREIVCGLSYAYRSLAVLYAIDRRDE